MDYNETVIQRYSGRLAQANHEIILAELRAEELEKENEELKREIEEYKNNEKCIELEELED